MDIETRFFDNFNGQKTREKFSHENERLFKKRMPEILKSWADYLRVYAEKSEAIFGGSEFPWLKFDEPTWVSSLSIAIAKNYPDAILVEELPVKKQSGQDGKSTDYGNADVWCCLNPSSEKDRFCFYLEAKFSPGSRRVLAKHQNDKSSNNVRRISLSEVHNEIASNNKHSLFSRMFRDYQKSAGKKNTTGYCTTTSPHKKESNRSHPHVFMTLLIRPLAWDDKPWTNDHDEKRPRKIAFSDIFKDKFIYVHYKQNVLGNSTQNTKPTRKNIYNLPCAGIIMRGKDGYGFIALALMLGEAKHDDMTN